MLIDIVILPPIKIRNKIGLKFKKEITKFPNVFVVDNKKFIPHLSLWHLKTSITKIEKFSHELNMVAKGQKPIKIISADFHIVDKYKVCLSSEVQKSDLLESFQQKVFQTSYRFSTGMMPQFFPAFGKWADEELEEAKKYGKPLRFNPHITAGWLKKEADAQKIVRMVKGVKYSFLAKEIYICEINKWWQVKKIIKKISFT